MLNQELAELFAKAADEAQAAGVPGLHFSRNVTMDPSLGSFTINIADKSQCQTEKRDQFGETQCTFPWGSSIQGEFLFKDWELLQGTKMKVKAVVPMGQMVGMQPIEFTCPVCQGTCRVPIIEALGMKLIPTMANIKKTAFGGQAQDMLNKVGMSLPRDNRALEMLMNGAMLMSSAAMPNFFPEGAFSTGEWITVKDDHFELPMPTCPLTTPDFGSLKLPMGNGHGFRMDKEGLAFSVTLPAQLMGMSPSMLNGAGGIELTLFNNEKTLLEFNGKLGFNMQVDASN